MQTKDEKIRFETSLRNKDSEVVRLQMLFDREKGKVLGLTISRKSRKRGKRAEETNKL